MGNADAGNCPPPAVDAIVAALRAFGKDLSAMGPDEPLWPSRSDPGRGIASATLYQRFRKYLRIAGLPEAGVHITRHTAAKLRRDAGAPLEEVSAFLDHSSLAVTSVYLRRLEGQRDSGWSKVAVALGV